MFSPWGKVDHKVTLQRGLHIVSTPGHGGLAVSKALARKILREKAIKVAIDMGGYYWFEEDCNFDVALYDSATIISAYVKNCGGDLDATYQRAKLSVERWNPEYFNGR